MQTTDPTGIFNSNKLSEEFSNVLPDEARLKLDAILLEIQTGRVDVSAQNPHSVKQRAGSHSEDQECFFHHLLLFGVSEYKISQFSHTAEYLRAEA